MSAHECACGFRSEGSHATRSLWRHLRREGCDPTASTLYRQDPWSQRFIAAGYTHPTEEQWVAHPTALSDLFDVLVRSDARWVGSQRRMARQRAA